MGVATGRVPGAAAGPWRSEVSSVVRSARRWAPGYLVALFLVVAPLTDLLLRVRPWSFSSVEWRYGSAGFVSLSLEAPFIGLFLAMLVAGVLRHGRTMKVLSVLAFLLAPAFLGLGAMFALDAQQMRGMLNPAIMRSFEIGSLIVLAKYGFGALLAMLLGWAGWKLEER